MHLFISHAIIQGIIQGLTEFLPISSSGHLLLAQHVLGVTENNLFLNVMLHIGTLLAVLAVYYKLIFRLIIAFFGMIKDIFIGKFSFKDLDEDKHMIFALILGLLPLFLLFFPIGFGWNLKKVSEALAAETRIISTGSMLFFTSMLLFRGMRHNKWHQKKGTLKENLTYKDAFYIGLMQLMAAVFPGLSRSGSTLSIGLMRGVNKQKALDFSFILGVPAIIAAACVELKEAAELNALQNIAILPILIGTIVSAIVGFLSIKLFKWLLKTDKMSVFIWYTLLAGCLVTIVAIIELIYKVNIFTGVPL